MGAGFNFKNSSFKNIIPILTILLGIVTVTQPKIANIELNINQVILVMLTLIATEFFIDKITASRKLDEEIQFLRKYITGRTTASDALKSRKDFDRMENIISEASKDVIVVGNNLQSVVEIVNSIKQRLKDGISFSFFALDPNGDVLKALYPAPIEFQRKQTSIKLNLQAIHNALKDQGTFTIHLVDEFLTYGCICIDNTTSKNQLIFQHNLNGIPSELAPYVVINRSDTRWNKIYCESIMHLTKHSKLYNGDGATFGILQQ